MPSLGFHRYRAKIVRGQRMKSVQAVKPRLHNRGPDPILETAPTGGWKPRLPGDCPLLCARLETAPTGDSRNRAYRGILETFASVLYKFACFIMPNFTEKCKKFLALDILPRK